jgi:DNA-binding transcriptional ArsR family regulator
MTMGENFFDSELRIRAFDPYLRVGGDGALIPEPPAMALEAQNLIAVLANAIRVDVLTSLASDAKCVGDIANGLNLDLSTVSHALRKLRESGLVERHTVDRRQIYRVSRHVRRTQRGQVVELEINADALQVTLKVGQCPNQQA